MLLLGVLGAPLDTVPIGTAAGADGTVVARGRRRFGPGFAPGTEAEGIGTDATVAGTSWA